MKQKQPYTHVRLICSDDGDLNQRYEIRVSTFVQFDDNPGRRAISGQPTKKQAETIAKEIARSERIGTGAPDWNDTTVRGPLRPAGSADKYGVPWAEE